MAGQRRSSILNVDGSEFLRGLEAAFVDMERVSEEHVLALGIGITNRAKELCPVDKGRLRSSIISVPGQDAEGFFIEVGTDVDYAPYVEFGTSVMGPQPFMRPALAEVAHLAADIIAGGGGRSRRPHR